MQTRLGAVQETRDSPELGHAESSARPACALRQARFATVQQRPDHRNYMKGLAGPAQYCAGSAARVNCSGPASLLRLAVPAAVGIRSVSQAFAASSATKWDHGT